ncbi:MAG: dockerin type I repeat-containing protein, partial [Lachnospira sp.]|nr:dockerin type I repeat-containing protein [Lachnospira sp.]
SVVHSYTSAITKEPTCTATGIRTYTCTCGYTYDETIDAAGHKEVNGGSADCHIKCSVCGDNISAEHRYGSTVTKDSTCTTEGERKYTCECGYSYTEVIAAKGHTEVNGGVLASHKKCSVCGDILSTAHSYVSEVTKNPTCTQKGIRTYTCQCGYNYTEDIDEVAHTEVYGGTKASHTYCSVCTLILSNVHSYTSKVTTEATCTRDGVKTYSCECGHSYTEKIGATGHTEVNGGIKDCHKKCSVCGDVLSTAHSYSAKVTTEATCTRDGVKTYTCGCGYSYTEKIGATGHIEVNGGTKDCHKKCSVCGDVLSTAHSYTSEVTKDATEKEEGILTYTCTCGHSYTETIPVLEPSFLYGDVNRDGKVDTKDAVMFKQYLAGMNIDMDLNAADVNIDNKVDTKDVVKLMKYLAGVNGVILGQAD